MQIHAATQVQIGCTVWWKASHREPFVGSYSLAYYVVYIHFIARPFLLLLLLLDSIAVCLWANIDGACVLWLAQLGRSHDIFAAVTWNGHIFIVRVPLFLPLCHLAFHVFFCKRACDPSPPPFSLHSHHEHENVLLPYSRSLSLFWCVKMGNGC